MKQLLIFPLLCLAFSIHAQTSYTQDPQKAALITSDIPLFWKAFDQMDTKGNPFKEYLNEGSEGLKGFIKYRIESAKNLQKVAKKRKADYDKIRAASANAANYEDQIKQAYQSLKEWYPEAVFPPAYFVIGVFNSGGTSTDVGIIMGVEMQQDMSNLPYIVAHELIHYNQQHPNKDQTLLSQSIMEGSADFIGELISGKHINKDAQAYGNANEAMLCKEFVGIMNDDDYQGWLYGGKRKEGRPADLGYWIGYKISEAYFDKAKNKKQAVSEILNVQDFDAFLKTSGYLAEYLD